ncbi:acyl-CoA synthetase [Bacillus sp. AFS077874]|uniref:AMP-binding protein n=1 Tax=unclassified Bacillus (in: firmicutes) TaxID=185979 RepID=UPI000BEC23D7|nr:MULTISPECIES: AMP-binding protein [unclassified Bacillus (in: firmicutes)]PEC48607.1 acyl-CoA synthetase [Bacillus sp. AFS096315]PFM82601.1 acyl-CoA synthetase [Bacillus sp. AFS077874]
MANITETYQKNAILSPDKIAIHTSNQQISYKEWNQLINQTANWLHSYQSNSKTIGILLPNGISFLQMFTGASKAGWIAVPYDMKWNLADLEKRVKLSNPSVIVTTKDMYNKIHSILPNVKIIDDIFQEIGQFDSLYTIEINENLPFYVGFTSGTTGSPKAFIRSQDSWVASFDCNRFDFGLDETDQTLIPGALIHSHFLYGAISTLYLGGTVILLEKFSPLNVISRINSFPITTIYVVPTMIEALIKEGIQVDRAMKILSSGAKWTEKSKIEFRHLFPGMTIYEFFGASELSFITVLSDQDGVDKAKTVGKPCYGVQLQIRRPDQELAKPNETGKIYVKSKYLINGYFEENERTIYSIQDDDGWATVHDMGFIDEDGFLTINGREKNMILYGGINIFPEEIEKVISLHPDVEEVAVVGLSNPYWGQIVAAVIKGKSNSFVLKRFCKTHLSAYKIPRKWFFQNEMPYTTSGKIARAELIKQIEMQVTNN